MDYNKDNKGFVCWVYNFQRTRILWMALFALCLGKLVISAAISPIFADAAEGILCVKLRFATLFIAVGALIATINPKLFSVKLIAYAFVLLGAIFGIDFATSDFSGVSEVSFPFGLPMGEILPFLFSVETASNLSPSNFIAPLNLAFFIFIGATFLVMLLSWFVYNARSSEINQI